MLILFTFLKIASHYVLPSSSFLPSFFFFYLPYIAVAAVCCGDKELLPARAMVQRLRKRDLFAFAGEILLTPQRQAELKLTGHDATGQIKNEILSLVSNEKYDDAAATGSVISSSDMFIEIVKISYGKGSKNPVSGPTAFYAPKKQQQQQLQHHEDVKENDEQDRYWNVGVVPQGS